MASFLVTFRMDIGYTSITTAMDKEKTDCSIAFSLVNFSLHQELILVLRRERRFL